MYRRRLRPKYTPEELRHIYHAPHDSNRWADHQIRVRQTVALGKEATLPQVGGRIADLSCGNALIPRILADHFKAEPFLGDFAYKPGYLYTGPIEKTIHELGVNVELFVCSETIEHLDDPDGVLAQIRKRAGQLLLSTPIGENDTVNPEHYWGWDQEAVESMLEDAGWHPMLRTDLNFYHPNYTYNYQIWLCQ